MAGGAAEQVLLLFHGNTASVMWFYSRLIDEETELHNVLFFAVSGHCDLGYCCWLQQNDTTIEFCLWSSVTLSSLTSASTQVPKPKHVLVFQHIPLYLKSPDEDDDYFNLQMGVRQNLLDKFKKAGRRRGDNLLDFYIFYRFTLSLNEPAQSDYASTLLKDISTWHIISILILCLLSPVLYLFACVLRGKEINQIFIVFKVRLLSLPEL